MARHLGLTLAVLGVTVLLIGAGVHAESSTDDGTRCPLGLVVHAWPDVASAKSDTELERELRANQERLDKLRANIARAESARQVALEDIEALDGSIDELEGDLEKATAALESARADLEAVRTELASVTQALEEKAAQLAKTEADLAKEQLVLEQRAVSIYKAGGRLSFMAGFLQTHRLTDLVTRVDLLTAIVRQDDRLLTQIKTLRSRVATEKEGLQQQRALVAALEKKQTAKTRQVASVVAEQEAAVSRLEDARAAKVAVVKKAESDKASWEGQEDELLAESDRISDLLRSRDGEQGTVSKGSGVLSWPVSGEVTSGFGYRIHPIFHVRKMHTGIDISAAYGTSIHAAAAGTVVSAGWRGGYGNAVVVSHGDGLATLYAHASSLSVSEGDKVKQGQVIGKVGSTGYSTGPHLHFEVRVGGSPVNPMNYL